MIEGNVVITASGRVFDLVNPTDDQIDIYDIATALSHEARFGGHTKKLYSVAQHSCLAYDYTDDIYANPGAVIEIIPGGGMLIKRGQQIEALLHDATEAYYKDIPSPLKRLLPEYKKLERNCDIVIRKKFNLPDTMSPSVHNTDLRLLATEKRDLMPQALLPWAVLEGVEPYNDCIEPWDSEKAYYEFMKRFNKG